MKKLLIMMVFKGNFDFTASKYLLSGRSRSLRVGFLEVLCAGAGVSNLRPLVRVLLALTDCSVVGLHHS